MVVLVVVGALAAIGDRPAAVLAYFAVWLVSTTLPGVLIWRALSRPTSVVQEIGFGSVLGIGLLLFAWVPATLLGQPLLMWLWPAGVVAVFAGVPSLRGHWRPDRVLAQPSKPGRWHTAMMVVAVIAFLRLWSKTLHAEPLPPHASTIFQDVWYELALTQRLGHGFLINDPAAAGVPLHYHWFSNAHAAATQALSGTTADEVILHLWLVPMLFTFLFATVAAAERILEGAGDPAEPHGRWWAGPLAALLAVALPVPLFLGEPRLTGIDNGFVASSTSGVLALTITLALVGPVLDLLHGRGVPGTWVVLVLLLALSAGSKPSILPVVACGSALVLVVQWVRDRAFPKVPAVLTLLPLLLIPVAALAVVGSTGGSRLQLFDTLSLDPALGRAAGSAEELSGHGGWLAPDLVDGSGHVWGVAAGLLLLYVLTELTRVLGLFGMTYRGLRADPGRWWCSGVVAAGFCGLWVLAHPGHSQHYFWRIVVGLGVVLTVTSAVELLPQQLPVLPPLRRFGVGGLAVGLALLPSSLWPAGSMPRRLAPYALAAAVLAVLLVLSRSRWGPHAWRRTRLPVLVVVTCFCIATALPIAVGTFGLQMSSALVGIPAKSGPSRRYVSTDEQSAALWLQRHSRPDDIVATNVYCALPSYQPDCAHVSFWVAALTGRQLYVGAWAYTEKSLSNYAHGNRSYQQTPSPWPRRVALSLKAVRAPNFAVIARLRDHGVRWIFADRRATSVSSRLDRQATLRFANSDVRVYELADH